VNVRFGFSFLFLGFGGVILSECRSTPTGVKQPMFGAVPVYRFPVVVTRSC